MKTRSSSSNICSGKPFVRWAFALAVSAGSAAHAQMPAAWNSAVVTSGVDYVAAVGSGTETTMTWGDTIAWSGGVVANTAGKTVSLEPRQTGAMTVTVGSTYTIGSLTSRNPNNNIAFTGAGKLIFDNGSNPSIWNLNSRVTRFTNLRPDINIDIQLNSNLEIRMGSARSEEAAVGRIGKVISGDGKLTLTLGQNDATTGRLFKLGNGATANSYAGGTEIRHIESISGAGEYGSGFGSQGETLLVNALSTGTFGTGNVVLNSQGLNTTAVTVLTAATGGLQLKLSANNVMASTAKLTQGGNGAGLVLLEATQQTIAGLESTGTTTEQGRKRISSLAGAALTLNTQSSQSYSYGGRISGPTSVTVNGSGIQYFTNTNTYTGNTIISSGTLQFGKRVSLYDAGAAATWTNANLIQVSSGATLAVNVGAGDEFTSTDLDTLKGLGGLASGARLGIDTTNAGGSFSYSSGITEAIGITKLGTGTLTLGGTNTYSGTTIISAGTLALGSSATLSGSPSIDVRSGASFDVSAVSGGWSLGATQTLKGNGTVIGNFTATGTVAPGASIGTLDIDNNLTFGLNSDLDIEYSGLGLGSIDLLAVGGVLDITNATVNFSQLGPDVADDFYYVFASYGSLTGTFAGTTGIPTGYYIDYAFNNGVTSNNIALVPEPAAALLAALGLLPLALRRKR